MKKLLTLLSIMFVVITTSPNANAFFGLGSLNEVLNKDASFVSVKHHRAIANYAEEFILANEDLNKQILNSSDPLITTLRFRLELALKVIKLKNKKFEDLLRNDPKRLDKLVSDISIKSVVETAKRINKENVVRFKNKVRDLKIALKKDIDTIKQSLRNKEIYLKNKFKKDVETLVKSTSNKNYIKIVVSSKKRGLKTNLRYYKEMFVGQINDKKSEFDGNVEELKYNLDEKIRAFKYTVNKGNLVRFTKINVTEEL